jgi:hypothetical protein
VRAAGQGVVDTTPKPTDERPNLVDHAAAHGPFQEHTFHHAAKAQLDSVEGRDLCLKPNVFLFNQFGARKREESGIFQRRLSRKIATLLFKSARLDLWYNNLPAKALAFPLALHRG